MHPTYYPGSRRLLSRPRLLEDTRTRPQLLTLSSFWVQVLDSGSFPKIEKRVVDEHLIRSRFSVVGPATDVGRDDVLGPGVRIDTLPPKELLMVCIPRRKRDTRRVVSYSGRRTLGPVFRPWHQQAHVPWKGSWLEGAGGGV